MAKKYPPAQKDKNRRICTCCGSEFFAFPSAIRASCGEPKCRAKNASLQMRKHGMAKSRLHNIWCGMKARTKGTAGGLATKYYAGITLAEEWQQFEAFRDWSISNGYSEELEIDRRDNKKGYSPENCRWATRTQQMQNTSIRKMKKRRLNIKASRN
jgi:hypothetical protein